MINTADELFAQATKWIAQAHDWAENILFSPETTLQASAMLVSLLVAKLAVRPIIEGINYLSGLTSIGWLNTVIRRLESIAYPLCALLILWIVTGIFIETESPVGLLRIAVTLIGVWAVIRFTATFVANRTLARWISILAWGIAALNILGLLEPTMRQLDGIGMTVGENRITLLIVVKGVLTFAALVWGAFALSSLGERRIHNMTTLTPSLRVLIIKISRILLISFAFLLGLNTLGIDLTSLAVFSGAIGVGIGFGLQKVVSNFISGIILLLDRSIKPGDVINIGETYGWVNTLGARCVSLITRDGKEHLIPNELLITERVENWSYSNRDIRIRIPVGISYDSDVRKALELMIQTATDNPRILKDPAPNALVTGFGDSAVDLELRAWMNDPANGIGNVKSSLLLDIWDAFHEHKIQFPYPQMDVHIQRESRLTVKSES